MENWSEAVIHSFNNDDGWEPEAPVTVGGGGTLYGTTVTGGGASGIVFELSQGSGGSWTETVLHDFNTTGDGHSPEAGLTLDNSGHLYGTTLVGGAYGAGIVFAVDLRNTPRESVIYSFGRGASDGDGRNPYCTLLLNSDGDLLGVTEGGGTYFQGAVFRLTQHGSGWTETTVYSFKGLREPGGDGASPSGGLVSDAAGNLYGTTTAGGSTNCNGGCGVVFKLTRNSNGSWTESVIYTFQGGTDGELPGGPLVFDGSGNLYGATLQGGYRQGYLGYGTVFKLTPGSGGQWTETALYRFSGGVDGAYPFDGVVLDSAGILYGTTQTGGTVGFGTVFEVIP